MLATVAAVLVAAVQAQALTPQEEQIRHRTDLLASFSVAAPVCRELGYDVSPSLLEIFGNGQADLTSSSTVSSAQVQQWLNASIQRHSIALNALFDAAVSDQETGRPSRASLVTALTAASATCNAASQDAVGGEAITAPPGFDRQAAVRITSDRMLEAHGEASWQTPEIYARGNLFATLGACHMILPEARLTQLRQSTMPSADRRTAREREFYDRQYAAGLGLAATMNMDRAECDRAIASGQAQVSRAR